MKKILLIIMLLVMGYGLLGYSVKAQIDDIQLDAEATSNITGEHIKSFNSNISINKDGTVDVKETIIYDFDYLNKHGIYREIPFVKKNQDGKEYKMDLGNISVTDENGRPYHLEKSWVDEKILKLKIGDADKLISGIHTYLISYKVSGALTYFSDHDELYWNVNGNQWTVPTQKVTSEVHLPAGIKSDDIKTVCYTGAYGSKESLCLTKLLSQSDRYKIVNTSKGSLGSGEGLSIVIGFPKNIVAVLEPKAFVPFSETFLGRLVTWLLGFLALCWYVFLPFFIIYKWWKTGRDPQGTVGVTTAWFDPPKTQDGKRFLTPGEVGTLVDETADMKDISATIVDLARRGYLIIDERKKGDFYLIRLRPEEVGTTARRGKREDALLNYEKLLLDKFFGSKKEIRIKDQELSTEVAQIKNEMYEQVVKDKLFDKNPQTTRTKYYALAGVGLFTGNFFLAIVAFLFGRVMPRKTVYGVEAKNVSFSLKNFLTSQQRQLEFQADKQLMFERLLPFAIAFGVEKIWAKRFESLNITQPTWYRSYSLTNFNSYLLVNSLNSSMRSLATAATPTRSSTGYSSGFSEGFSGGGGGGGGGGSW